MWTGPRPPDRRTDAVVTVRLPRADWETIVMVLEDMRAQGWYVAPLISELSSQVGSQEY